MEEPALSNVLDSSEVWLSSPQTGNPRRMMMQTQCGTEPNFADSVRKVSS